MRVRTIGEGELAVAQVLCSLLLILLGGNGGLLSIIPGLQEMPNKRVSHYNLQQIL